MAVFTEKETNGRFFCPTPENCFEQGGRKKHAEIFFRKNEVKSRFFSFKVTKFQGHKVNLRVATPKKYSLLSNFICYFLITSQLFSHYFVISLMPIPILTSEEIKKMRVAGKAAASVLDMITPYVQEGVSTGELNRICHEYILENGWIPAPLNYHGFPKSICTSINNVICHGIPSEKEKLLHGDIVNIDITVIVDGYHGDTSRMFAVGDIAPEDELLIKRTKEAMMRGIGVVKPGVSLNEIGKTIEKYISKFNYGIVKDFTGHGIGKDFHCDPHVHHYYPGYSGPRLEAGMAFTVEPMLNATPHWEALVDKNDKWTVRTKDGAKSAQWEHTILVTPKGYEILTLGKDSS